MLSWIGLDRQTKIVIGIAAGAMLILIAIALYGYLSGSWEP